MKQGILYFDNTAGTRLIFLLQKNNKIIRQERSVIKFTEQKILAFLEKFLNANKIKTRELAALAVNLGPGAFSNLRKAVVTFNILAWVLKIPIVGIKAGEFQNERELFKLIQTRLKNKKFLPVVPFYDKEPNITKPKSSL
jgi:tRNA A37 threonylcarbamoyladenosine modification protein TsaB